MEKVTKFKVINVNDQVELYDTEEEALKVEKEVKCYKQISQKVYEDIVYFQYKDTVLNFVWDNAKELYEILKQRFE